MLSCVVIEASRLGGVVGGESREGGHCVAFRGELQEQRVVLRGK